MSIQATKRALVVGGTSGIGQGIALALAQRDYQVIVCGRSAERGTSIVTSLQPPSTPGVEHIFLPIDAFDLSSVKTVAEESIKDGKQVDVLVMTHSMATLQGYTPTKDGIDQKMQLHYFSRIYLASLLAPHMPPNSSQILSVLSAGVHSKYKHADDDFELKKHYSVKNAADAAGYYNDAGFETLSELHPNITFCHAAPGFVNTNWGTEMPWLVRTMLRPVQAAFGKSLEKCGEILTSGLLDIKSPGYYLMDENGKLLSSDKVKHTRQERDVIWEKTLKLLPDL
jgi:NAD(P)-dependent dehydrogenase (short-subunit alcohol dehydrogenase family)